METKNSCYTYFKIVGNFDPDDVTKALKLTPESSCRIGDRRRDGGEYGFALWTVGKCTEYSAHVEDQMRKTVSVLADKIPELNRIREGSDVSFFLEVVPSVYVNDVAPCLAPPLDVIDFLHATRTEMDIDLYVYGEEEE